MRWQMARSQRMLAAEKRDALIVALAEAYFRRGTQKLLNNPTGANEDFQEAANLCPDDALYTYYVGLSWHRTGSLNQAVDSYRKALKLDPTFTRAEAVLGLALTESGQDVTRDPAWNQLNTEQQAYLQQKPTGTPLSQALAHMAANRWDTVAPLIETALDDDTSVLARYYQGVLHARAGDDAAALDQWQQAYDNGLSTPHLVNNLTLAYTLRAETALAEGRTDEALDYAEKGLAIEAAHLRLSDIYAFIHFERGYQAAEQGNWQRALDEWKRVEFAVGANARALAANIALAHEKMGEEFKAAEAWREFARRRPRKEGSDGWLAPQQVARLWTRISELYLKAGVSEDAITTLQTALKYQPDDVELGLSLVRCYINDDRTEAAHNQLDRMLKVQPDHVGTLVLKAELTEAAPPNRWYSPFYSELPGIAEWKAVLATGDESYVSVARQRLMELYEDAFEEALEWGVPGLAKQKARAAFEIVPDDHFLRARYVYVLLLEKPSGNKAKAQHEADIRAQVDLIDITDENALHQLIDAWHLVDRHTDAAATLEKANAAKTLGPEFYMGIGACALGRKQREIAQAYFDEVMRRVEPEKRFRQKARIGVTYAERGDENQAEVIWKQILEEDPAYGYAHHYLWILNHRRNKQREAQKHLKQAQRWANDHRDDELKTEIEHMRMMFSSPLKGLFSRLPPGLDPRDIPPELLERMLGGILGDEFDDDDLPPFGRRRR